MKKITLLLLLLFIMISSFVFSQEKINQTDIIKGTFQLETLKIDAEPVSERIEPLSEPYILLVVF